MNRRGFLGNLFRGAAAVAVVPAAKVLAEQVPDAPEIPVAGPLVTPTDEPEDTPGTLADMSTSPVRLYSPYVLSTSVSFYSTASTYTVHMTNWLSSGASY